MVVYDNGFKNIESIIMFAFPCDDWFLSLAHAWQQYDSVVIREDHVLECREQEFLRFVDLVELVGERILVRHSIRPSCDPSRFESISFFILVTDLFIRFMRIKQLNKRDGKCCVCSHSTVCFQSQLYFLLKIKKTAEYIVINENLFFSFITSQIKAGYPFPERGKSKLSATRCDWSNARKLITQTNRPDNLFQWNARSLYPRMIMQ